MKGVVKLLAVFLISVSFIPTQAQKTPSRADLASIDFDPIRLILGMPEEHVITLLTEHYSVSKWTSAEKADTWGVGEKKDPHLLVGTLEFVGGKLAYVTRIWKTESTDSSLATALFNLVTHLNAEGYRNCSIGTLRDPRPEDDRKTTEIDCGRKGILLELDQLRENVAGVNIYEELH